MHEMTSRATNVQRVELVDDDQVVIDLHGWRAGQPRRLGVWVEGDSVRGEGERERNDEVGGERGSSREPDQLEVGNRGRQKQKRKNGPLMKHMHREAARQERLSKEVGDQVALTNVVSGSAFQSAEIEVGL